MPATLEKIKRAIEPCVVRDINLSGIPANNKKAQQIHERYFFWLLKVRVVCSNIVRFKRVKTTSAPLVSVKGT